MRLERDDAVRDSRDARQPPRFGDHRLVAAMYTVEIAERDNGAAGLDGQVRMMAENAHARGESCSRTTSTRHCRASVRQYRRRGAAANGRGEPAKIGRASGRDRMCQYG